MTIKIKKRQGYLVNYDKEQLYHSIEHVLDTVQEQAQVVCYCDSKIKALDGVKSSLSIEELLDLIHNSLLELNFKDAAAKFSEYREERKRVREAKKIKVDVESTIEDYVGQLDWRVNENANQGYSVGGMILNTSGKVTANYWLSSVYPERVGQAHRDGRIHIHDLSFLGCYCLAGSTKIRLLDGRVKSIKWLAENMQNEEFEVMSYDLDKMEPAVGTAYKPRLTRKHAETITLVLDNGKQLTCTPDHKILTRDGVYVEAGNLHIGDSLMPMNIKMNPLFKRLSISTYSVARKKLVYGQLHRVLFELTNRKLKKNEIAHHINGNKFDNRTCNLQAMDDSEHRAMEFSKTNSRPDVKAKYSALLSAYNKSDEKRKLASKFARTRKRDAEGRFVNVHNHKVVAIKKGTTQDVYCMTVKNYHNFAIDAGIVVKNCCGWDLKRLLDEGLNGLRGHIDSKPPKNLSGAVGQMVNALGVLQNEAAGAQAYSSADTYLAPFVRELKKKIISEYRDIVGMTGGTVDENINADRLKAYIDEKLHKEVYQCIQELIFNLNVPSRWGCVPLDTEVLTPNGWKHYDELQKNDEIFSYNTDTKTIELDRVKAIVKKKNTSGVLHCYINEKKGYEQCVTPEHRVIHKKLGSSEYQISRSEELWTAAVRQAAKLDKKTVGLVNFANGFNNDNDGLTDEEVMLAAFIYTDGILDWRKNKTVIHRIGWLKSSKRWGRKEFKECSRKLRLDWKHKHKCVLRRINGVEWTCDMHSYRCYGDSARKIAELIGHKTSIHERFFRMNERHAKLFLDTWRKTDGYGASLQCDSELIASQIQHIATLAGYRSAITKGASFRVKLKRKSVAVYPTKVQEISYSGDVWCPSVVKNGTAIFRRNGKTFISGQSQTPFTNLTFDLNCPEDLKDKKPKIGGVEVEDYTYGDLQEEMNLLNNVFVEVYMKGDAKGQPFTFPIPTYNITNDFDWNSKFVDAVFEMAAKYGLPYFQNFISSDMEPSQIRSMCCRLRLDKRELLKRGNGLFGSAEQTGSIGVVTINLARLGYKHKGDKEGLYKELDELLIIAKDSLEIKRAIVSKLLDQGFYPALSRYLSHFDNHFSTIGINGGNEMIRNFTNDEEDISTEYGQKMMLDMMDYLRQRMADFQEETGNLYNLEAAPCEGCFAGDTLVQTYEGNIAIKELVGKKDLLVYSRNNKTNKVELKKARAYQTSKKAEVLEIEFDNGQKIVCTPQHPIARNHWNGRRGTEIEWVPAELLQPGMSIKSNYIYDKQGHLYSSCDRRAIHVVNAEYAYGPRKKGYVVHHKDENKHNNAFENLQYLTSTEHKSLHWGVGGNPSSVNPRYGEANPFYGKKHTAESKAKMSAALKGRHWETNDMEAFRKIMSDSAKAKPREKTSKFRHDIDESKILNLWNKGYDLIEICEKLPEKYAYSLIKGRLKHLGIDISLRARVVRNNHKVVAIRRLSKKIPVYNIEVQDNHNYFVGGAQGILVHNCMYRFALADKKAFGDDIIQAGPKEAPYYTNSSQLPVSFTDDIFEALDLQNDLQCKYTGGTVLHLYMAERVSNVDIAKTLVRKIFQNYTLPYITFTPTFSICPIHGYLAGEHEYCPICDAEIEKRVQSCCNCEPKTI